jgi:hypothetical protein
MSREGSGLFNVRNIHDQNRARNSLHKELLHGSIVLLLTASRQGK